MILSLDRRDGVRPADCPPGMVTTSPFSPDEEPVWKRFALSRYGQRLTKLDESVLRTVQIEFARVYRLAGEAAASRAILRLYRSSQDAKVAEGWFGPYGDFKRPIPFFWEPRCGFEAFPLLGRPWSPEGAEDYLDKILPRRSPTTNSVILDFHNYKLWFYEGSERDDRFARATHDRSRAPGSFDTIYLTDRDDHVRLLDYWRLAFPEQSGYQGPRRCHADAKTKRILSEVVLDLAARYWRHVLSRHRLAASTSKKVLTAQLLRSEWGPHDLPALARLAAIRIVMEAERQPHTPNETVDISDRRLAELLGTRPGHVRRLVIPHLSRVTLAGKPLFSGVQAGKATFNVDLCGLLDRQPDRTVVTVDTDALRGLSSRHALALALPMLGMGVRAYRKGTWTLTVDELRRVLCLPEGTQTQRVAKTLREAISVVQEAVGAEIEVRTERRENRPGQRVVVYVLTVGRVSRDPFEGLNRDVEVERNGLPWEWRKPSRKTIQRRIVQMAETRRTRYTAHDRRTGYLPWEAGRIPTCKLEEWYEDLDAPAVPGRAGVRVTNRASRTKVEISLHPVDVRLGHARRKWIVHVDVTRHDYNLITWLCWILGQAVDGFLNPAAPADYLRPVDMLIHHLRQPSSARKYTQPMSEWHGAAGDRSYPIERIRNYVPPHLVTMAALSASDLADLGAPLFDGMSGDVPVRCWETEERMLLSVGGLLTTLEVDPLAAVKRDAEAGLKKALALVLANDVPAEARPDVEKAFAGFGGAVVAPPPAPPPAPAPLPPDRTIVDMRLSGVALRARIVAGTTVVTAGDHSHCLGDDAAERLRKEPLGSLIDACAAIARQTDDDLVLRLLLFLQDPWMMADACAAGHVRMSRDVRLPVLFDDERNMQIPLLLDDADPSADATSIRLPVSEASSSPVEGLPVLVHDHAVEELAISA